MNRFANSAFTDGSYAAASRGMSPRQHAIAEGTRLYRFVDLARAPSSVAANGPWWFEYEHYRTIVSFAERGGYSKAATAQMFAAILHEWGSVNAVVRARVVNGPLFCWKGAGRQVFGDPARKTPAPGDVATVRGVLTERAPVAQVKATPPQGPLQVLQLYIPGLGRNPSLFSACMAVVGVDRLD